MKKELFTIVNIIKTLILVTVYFLIFYNFGNKNALFFFMVFTPIWVCICNIYQINEYYKLKKRLSSVRLELSELSECSKLENKKYIQYNILFQTIKHILVFFIILFIFNRTSIDVTILQNKFILIFLVSFLINTIDYIFEFFIILSIDFYIINDGKGYAFIKYLELDKEDMDTRRIERLTYLLNRIEKTK